MEKANRGQRDYGDYHHKKKKSKKSKKHKRPDTVSPEPLPERNDLNTRGHKSYAPGYANHDAEMGRHRYSNAYSQMDV